MWTRHKMAIDHYITDKNLNCSPYNMFVDTKRTLFEKTFFLEKRKFVIAIEEKLLHYISKYVLIFKKSFYLYLGRCFFIFYPYFWIIAGQCCFVSNMEQILLEYYAIFGANKKQNVLLKMLDQNNYVFVFRSMPIWLPFTNYKSV